MQEDLFLLILKMLVFFPSMFWSAYLTVSSRVIPCWKSNRETWYSIIMATFLPFPSELGDGR